jgi:hypothetical protein
MRPDPVSSLATLRTWTARQWWSAMLAALGVALVIGLPTDVIPNPVFGRPVPVTWWSYPVLALTAVMGGLLIATYVRPVSASPTSDAEATGNDPVSDLDAEAERQAKTGGAAGLLSFFAVGCPVCNKIVLLAVGTAGARQWFEPFQPLLAVFSLALLGYALMARLASSRACPMVPPVERSTDFGDGEHHPVRQRSGP